MPSPSPTSVDGGATETMPDQDRPVLDPRSVADAALALASERSVDLVSLEAGPDQHTLKVIRGASEHVVGLVLPRIGDATAARIALLAGVDFTQPDEQLGRMSVRLGDVRIELLVVYREGPKGADIELRRIAGEALPWLPLRDANRDARCFGPYQIREVLGRGGTGIVYRAVHEALGREAAIKVLHDVQARHARSLVGFLREARAASRVEHPGIVQVLDFGSTTDGRTYLVMELVRWATLRTLMNDGPISAKRLLRLTYGLACALDAAHGAGVVHCDLKPDNVFVADDDQVKIGDFGAARLVEGAGDTSTRVRLVGTPAYMPPEVIRGAAADGRADMYSLGCSMYEALAGDVPFPHRFHLDAFRAHLEDPPPQIVTRDPLTKDLVALSRTLLAKEPAARPANAGVVAARLRAIGRAHDITLEAPRR